MRAASRSSQARVESRYRDNLARHLIAISRDLQARVRRRLRDELGYAGLRPSFGPFLSVIWDEGRPLASLARELTISNQACSQLANRVEAAGYLERRTNPADGRSKLVVLTRVGKRLVRDGVRIILESEADYRTLVGRRAYARFTASLGDLYEGLGLPTHADPALTARARQSVGVLPLIAIEVQRELMQATIERGHPGLKMSHGQVLSMIGPEGGRIHQMARAQRVSRQAISAVSNELKALGYLRAAPDPQDGRSRVLLLTPRGSALLRDSVRALSELEQRFDALLGARRLAQLERVARDLYDGLQIEAEIFGPDPHGRGAAGTNIELLASRLQRSLGSGDAARLGALLEPAGRPRA